MLRFKVHQVCVGNRRYILLPKMTPAQMQKLARRLAGRERVHAYSGGLSAASNGGTVHIDPRGLCWSSADSADAVLPVMTEVLESPKEMLGLDELRSLYFNWSGSNSTMAVRMSARLEGGSAWDELRASGGCALAPDERAVARFLMRASSSCELLCDFVGDGFSVVRHGTKRYCERELDATEADDTLRAIGEASQRNSYLHRDGLLKLHGFMNPPLEDWLGLFRDLGEWCFFGPGEHESSNSHHRRPIAAPVV